MTSRASAPASLRVAVPGTAAQPQGWTVLLHPMREPVTASFLQIMRERNGDMPGCVLCQKRFALGETFTHVIATPHGLFPNRFVHTACLDWEALETTVTALREGWTLAQQSKYWFQ